jgi:hypothetical protein
MPTPNTEELAIPVEVQPAVKLLSLNDLNATKASENNFEFEYLNEHGEETGFFITVIGDQSKTVKNAICSKINKERMQIAVLKKRGKDEPFKPIEDLITENVEGVAACIVGWRGVQEPYSIENAIFICENNKLIFDQVKAASENLANFTKSK